MKVSDFQFINPFLEELEFSVNPNFDKENVNVEMENKFNVKIDKSKTENSAWVKLTLDSNKNCEEAPFKLKISVVSEFRWESLEEDMVEAMLKINAPALLLGYMRPIVANITNSSCFPAYNIPFVNFKEW